MADKKRNKSETEEKRKSAVTVKDSDSRKKEAAGIAVGAAGLLLFISLLRKAGWLGNGIRLLCFGIFGPPISFGMVAVIFALAFCLMRGNAGKVFRARNIILLILFMLFASSFIFTVAEKDPCAFEFGKMLERSWQSSSGGVPDGLLSLCLVNLIDRAATFIVLVTGMLVCAILLFSISVIKFFKWIAGVVSASASKIKRISKRFKNEKDRQKAAGRQKKQEPESDEPEPAGGYTITDGGKTVYDPSTGEIIEEKEETDNKQDFESPEIITGEQLELNTQEKKEEKEYVFPGTELLTSPENADRQADRDKIQENAQKLEDVMRSFGVSAKVINVSVGPNVVRYELQPQTGVKVNQITSLANDIALNMATKGSVRIEAPIPGKAAIGIEVPNDERYTVYLKEIIESAAFKNSRSPLTVCLGKDVEGAPVVADIKKMPHLLIAGTTGSGKSILLNSIIVSILYKATPDEVKFIMLDPKIVELSVYNGIPHLLFPVVTDSKKAAGTLSWAVAEMEKRYDLFAKSGERDIESYNEYASMNGLEKIPSLVIIIDELADLMSVAKDSVETSINRLAAKARASGIYLIIATQRPSVNVITGTIKANIPTRISLYVSSFVDSKTVLDCAGAEKLLGKGDMLYMPNGKDSIKRIQCAYCDKEIKSIVSSISQSSPASYDENLISQVDNHIEVMEKGVRDESGKIPSDPGAEDEYLEQAVIIGLQSKKISASYLQTKLGIGFQRASRIIQWMEDHGVISQKDGNNPREILIESMDEYYKIKNSEGKT